MKRFLAVYTGSAPAMAKWESLSEDERKERQATGIAAWQAWVDKNKHAIIEVGAPLGRTKSISPAGIADIRNNLTAFTLVQAESHEAAAKLFEGHPHFMIFPGEAVEIRECLPIPTQPQR